MVCSRDVESVSKINKLTRDSSIQDALRMFLQPIKNDDPKLDFYTTYKREATEYDTEYMQNYNGDLDTTLILVRFRDDLVTLVLTPFIGRSILGGQLRRRHRHPIQTRARPRRMVGSIPPSNPPQHQPFHPPSSQARNPLFLRTGGSTSRDHHNLVSPVYKSTAVAICRIRHDAWQIVVERISQARWRIHNRALR